MKIFANKTWGQIIFDALLVALSLLIVALLIGFFLSIYRADIRCTPICAPHSVSGITMQNKCVCDLRKEIR